MGNNRNIYDDDYYSGSGGSFGSSGDFGTGGNSWNSQDDDGWINLGSSDDQGGWNDFGDGYGSDPDAGYSGYHPNGSFGQGGGRRGGPSKEIIAAIVIALLAVVLMGVTVKVVRDGDQKAEVTTEAKADNKAKEGNTDADSADVTESSSDTQATQSQGTTTAPNYKYNNGYSQQNKSSSSSGSTNGSAQSALNNYYVIEGSDSRYLTSGDLSGLSATQLRYARNEIYARHGRKFDSDELQNYFNSQAWYSGTVSPSDFNESVLNDYEHKNIDFIKAYEKGDYKSSANAGSSGSSSSSASYYILPQSSSSYITESDLSGLTETQVRRARNEIYARHGRKFDSDDLQDYFDSQSWYKGTVSPSDFSESVLNKYEKANVKTIKAYEDSHF